MKPSEMTPHTADMIEKLVLEYLDSDCFKVIKGGAEQSIEILEHEFDFIFFTGSTKIGKVYARAAAKHLTPTILELGGKKYVHWILDVFL